MNKKKCVTFWIDENEIQRFQVLYPRLLSHFIRRVIKKALNDSNFIFDIIKGGE